MLHLLTLPYPWQPLIFFIASLGLPFPECHIGEIMQCVAFSDWLLSLSNINFSSTPFHGLIAHFFLALNNIPLSECTTIVYSTTEGHLGCFQVLSIINKTARNILVQVFVWT